MIDADGHRLCDKEIWSLTRQMWCGCRKPANLTVPSKYICSGLDFCRKHYPEGNTQVRITPNYTEKRMTKAELLQLKDRIDRILNNVLCDMKPGWDDSIEGFNKAWDITRDIFDEEIRRVAQ